MGASTDLLKYFRIIALAFFVYDWMSTLPQELRLYKRQSGIRHLNTACILLIFTRYLGLIALCINLAAFFSHEFTDKSCGIFFRFLPISQCFASWASRAVFVIRTAAICNNEYKSRMFLVGIAVVCCGLEMFAQLYSFRKYKAGSSGNCLIQYSAEVNISWLYYVVASLFDLIVIYMTYRGLSAHHDARKDIQTDFSKVLWNSSLVYFAVTTFFNLLNLSFYAAFGNSNATIFCAMGIAFTSMMSVRVILNLQDYHHRPASVQLSGVHSSLFFEPASSNAVSISSRVTPTDHYVASPPAIAVKSEDKIPPAVLPKSYAAPWESHLLDSTTPKYNEYSAV